MSFLPKKFARSEEGTGVLLPTDNVCPLVYEKRQISVGLYPFAVHGADYRFARGTYAEPFGELFIAAVRNPSNLRGKAFDMLSFFFKKALGYEQREIGVDVSRLFKAPVHFILNKLPNAVTVGLYYHAPFHDRVIDHICFKYDVSIPLREVIAPRRNVCDELLVSFCHITS